MAMRTVMAVYGTRPEAIKFAPVLRALEASGSLSPVVIVTGQHREMLDQVNNLFGITPKHDLDIQHERQTLTDITTRVLTALGPVIEGERPDALMVQGDTTTTFAASLAAFYQRIPVVHLEAGLRTDNIYDPYPEEVNRRLTSQLATLHLAPTSRAHDNLLESGIGADAVVVTGNSVIDALLDVVSRKLPLSGAVPDLHGRVVLVTTHRRESWGEPMRRTTRALARLAGSFPDVSFVLPAHLNPVVREVLVPGLAGLPNVRVIDPLDYSDFASVMARCELVVTDSGGVQEEAPSLGKPVLVIRETTERPEAVEAGTVRLIGTQEADLVAEVTRLLTDRSAYDAMARAVNPYGDGHAAERCVAAVEHLFGLGPRLGDFSPDGR
jgi:UDP-N-acetylglucosamine 2-epimerase (non-hydrolysing)